MEIGKMEDFTIDQFAGSMALILGSIGGLLMIIVVGYLGVKGLLHLMKVRVMEKRIKRYNPNLLYSLNK
jgi:hypothetical protein